MFGTLLASLAVSKILSCDSPQIPATWRIGLSIPRLPAKSNVLPMHMTVPRFIVGVFCLLRACHIQEIDPMITGYVSSMNVPELKPWWREVPGFRLWKDAAVTISLFYIKVRITLISFAQAWRQRKWRLSLWQPRS